jgi:hypothetical protein
LDAVRPTADIIPSNLERLVPFDAPKREEAARLIREISPGGPIRIRIQTPMTATYRWPERLVQQLGRIGVELVIDEKDPAPFVPSDSETPFYLLRFIADVGDPFSLYRVFREGGPWVASLPARDATFEKLLDEGTDSEILRTHFRDRVYALPLFEQDGVYWINPARIGDMKDEAQRNLLRFEVLSVK